MDHGSLFTISVDIDVGSVSRSWFVVGVILCFLMIHDSSGAFYLLGFDFLSCVLHVCYVRYGTHYSGVHTIGGSNRKDLGSRHSCKCCAPCSPFRF